MNWLDILLLIILVSSIVSGLRRGFIRLGIGLISTVIGLVVASWFYASAGAWFVSFTHSIALANLMGFFFVFAIVLALGGVVSLILSRMLRFVGLGFFDRAGGAVFGAVQGVLIAMVVLIALMAFSPHNKVIAGSTFAPYIAGPARSLSALAPYEVHDGVGKAYDELRLLWRDATKPKKKLKTQDL